MTAGLDTDLDTVDGVELNVVVVDEALDLRRKVGLKAFRIAPAAVQQEGAAVDQLLGHVELADVCRVVACNEVRLAYQIGGLDGLFAEAEVGHGDTVLSPMILMEFLLAPTVPSAPRPQNLQQIVPSGVVTISLPLSRDRFVTSSVIPMVKVFLVVLL